MFTLTHGPLPHSVHHPRHTCLHFAAHAGNLEAVNILITAAGVRWAALVLAAGPGVTAAQLATQQAADSPTAVRLEELTIQVRGAG